MDVQSKKEIAKGLFAEHIAVFCCPICGGKFTATEAGVRCNGNHAFDLARKGYLNLFAGRQSTYYDKTLFTARRDVFAAGVYDLLIEEIASLIKELVDSAPLVLDAGCGECSILARIHPLIPQAGLVGVDISRDGIRLATVHSEPIMWCVADLARLPLCSGSLDVIVNVLAPANYNEFQRVLKPGGAVIKVLPGPGYLQEIRERLEGSAAYSNEDVAAKFAENLKVGRRFQLSYEVGVNGALWEALIKMTPLSSRREISGPRPGKITVDLEIIQGSWT
ncbi:MAG: methyltransferase domain-containing protein [Acutalibacteraceae bacterium]